MATRFTRDEVLGQMDVSASTKIENMLDIIDGIISSRSTLGLYNAALSKEEFTKNSISASADYETIKNNLTSRGFDAVYNIPTGANVANAFIVSWTSTASSGA